MSWKKMFPLTVGDWKGSTKVDKKRRAEVLEALVKKG